MVASMTFPDIPADDPVRPRCRDEDVDPDWWIEDDLPEGAASTHIAEARSRHIRAQLLCYECPLLVRCRASSWDEPAHIWAGLTYGERFRARVTGEVDIGLPRPLKDRSVKILAKVRQKYLNGDTPEEIAASMTLSVSRVRYHIRTLLIETRRFRERQQVWGHTPPPLESTITQGAFRAGLGASLGSLKDSA